MNTNRFIKILAVLLIAFSVQSFADEQIVDFSDKSVAVLNEELRKLREVTSSPAPSFPSGGIIMWSGTIAAIPAGWYLCDGNNGTPDLRDKFVIGAKQDDSGTPKTNVTGSLTQTGGEAAHTLTIEEMPAHTHTAAVHASNNRFNAGLPGHAEAGNTGSTGGGLAHNNLPPYYALAFIMKQ